MHKTIAVLALFALLNNQSLAQRVTGRLLFEQGQVLTADVEMKNKITQQAMGQAIDFTVTANAVHSFQVTNATEGNSTLRHQSQHISFLFDGMGQKKAFDSDNKKDMQGLFGKPVTEVLGKTYDMIIDSTGRTLLARPEKIELSKMDDRAAIVMNMLRDITSIVYPPKKGDPSFFSILPDGETSVGDNWTTSTETESGKSTTSNTLSAVTDSTIVVDFKSNSTTVFHSEMMGTQSVFNSNNVATGQVILDRVSKIIREKTTNVESTGTIEVMGNSMPVNAKLNIHIVVRKNQ